MSSSPDLHRHRVTMNVEIMCVYNYLLLFIIYSYFIFIFFSWECYTLRMIPGRDMPQLIYQRQYNGPVDPRRRHAVLFKTVQNADKRFAML